MLREDRTACIERIPGKWTGRFHKRTQLPDQYEFSVGKYTRSGNWRGTTAIALTLRAIANSWTLTFLGVGPVGDA